MVFKYEPIVGRRKGEKLINFKSLSKHFSLELSGEMPFWQTSHRSWYFCPPKTTDRFEAKPIDTKIGCFLSEKCDGL